MRTRLPADLILGELRKSHHKKDNAKLPMGRKKKLMKSSRRIYVDFKMYISQRPWPRHFIRIIRFLVLVGPWRHLIVKYYQRFSKNKPMTVNTLPFFLDLDLDKVVHNIGQDGYSMGIKLSEEYVDAIAKYYGDKKGKIHWDPHKTHKTIYDISHNSKIIDIVRKYLGVEPILHSSVLIWSFPRFDNWRNPSPFSHQHFHYEAGDIRSLNVFIYLTDTDRDCGPHVVIKNTHRYKTPPQFIKHTLTDNEAHEKYGDRVKVITGEKGTGFFEDTTAFHKQLINKKPRLILNLVYSMRRKPSLEQRFRSRFIRT